MSFVRQAFVTHVKPDGARREVKGLRISFELHVTDSPSTDVSRLSIYNLLPSSVKAFERDDTVQIEASYRDVDRKFALYSGQVVGIASEAENVDVRYDIDLAPTSLQGTQISRSWAGRQPLSQLVRDVVEVSRLTLSTEASIPSENVRNESHTGSALAVLNELLAPFGRSATQVGGEVRVFESGVSSDRFVRKVDEGSGMIGTPKLATDGGVVVRVVLNGSIEPNSRIDLTSRAVADANGIYRVASITHRGDTGNSPDWYTELTCHAVNA